MEVFFKKLAPYAPVQPPEALAAKAGLEVGQLIKIDANENPFGAPQCVRQALNDAFPLLSIYPGEKAALSLSSRSLTRDAQIPIRTRRARRSRRHSV